MTRSSYEGSVNRATNPGELARAESPAFQQPALAAAQVDGAGGLDIPLGVEEQDHGLGEDAVMEADQRRVDDDLVGDAGLGIGGDFQDVEVRFGLPVSPDLDQAVGQPAGLDQLGWKRLPGDDGMGPPGANLATLYQGLKKTPALLICQQADRRHRPRRGRRPRRRGGSRRRVHRQDALRVSAHPYTRCHPTTRQNRSPRSITKISIGRYFILESRGTERRVPA